MFCSVGRSLPFEERNHVPLFSKLESGIHQVLNLNARKQYNATAAYTCAIPNIQAAGHFRPSKETHVSMFPLN